MDDNLQKLSDLHSRLDSNSVTVPVKVCKELSDWLSKKKSETGITKQRIAYYLLLNAMAEDKKASKADAAKSTVAKAVRQHDPDPFV